MNTIINLNSIDAVKLNSTYNSSVVFSFPNIMSNKSRAFMKVLSCQVPVSFYNINETNNSLNFVVNGTPISILIDVGNYNSNTLAVAISTQLTSYGITMTIVLNKINGKYTFTISSGIFSILDTSTMLYILGLTGTKASTGTILVCDYPLNLLGSLNLYFTSNAFNCSTNNSSTMSNKNVFLSLDINVDVFSIIQLSQPTDLLKIHNKNITSVDIQILDDRHNLVNFNNANWSMSILVEWEDENNELIQPIFSENE